MICDALENLNRYRGLHKNLETAIDYLTAYYVAHDLSDLPLGRTEVDGENVFINVMEAGLNPEKVRRPSDRPDRRRGLGLYQPARRGSRGVCGRHRFQDQSGRRQRCAGRGTVRSVLPR